MAVEDAFVTPEMHDTVSILKSLMTESGGSKISRRSDLDPDSRGAVNTVVSFVDDNAPELYQREMHASERIVQEALVFFANSVLRAGISKELMLSAEKNPYVVGIGRPASFSRFHKFGLVCKTPSLDSGNPCGVVIEDQRNIDHAVLDDEFLAHFLDGRLDSRCPNEQVHVRAGGSFMYTLVPKHTVNVIKAIDVDQSGVDYAQSRQKRGDRLLTKVVLQLLEESDRKRKSNGTLCDARGLRMGARDEVSALQLIDYLASQRVAGGYPMISGVEFDNFPLSKDGMTLWERMKRHKHAKVLHPWAHDVTYRDERRPRISYSPNAELSLVRLVMNYCPKEQGYAGIDVRKVVPIRIQVATDVALAHMDWDHRLGYSSWVKSSERERAEKLGPVGLYMVDALSEKGFADPLPPRTFSVPACGRRAFTR
jgi:hypothetical protein